MDSGYVFKINSGKNMSVHSFFSADSCLLAALQARRHSKNNLTRLGGRSSGQERQKSLVNVGFNSSKHKILRTDKVFISLLSIFEI